jgi:hypothetical protein
MKELDLLKKSWQKDSHSFKQISESEIYKMIHKNSSSSVKWILIISILEFLFWLSINFIFNNEENLNLVNAEKLIGYLSILSYFNYAVILYFIYQFYRNYIKISTTNNTKQLMKDILDTRKTVRNYVWYNLGMIFICVILGYILSFLYSPELASVKHDIAMSDILLIKVIIVLFIVTTIFIVLVALFYRLLYGFFLRRLNRNYKELKSIDFN